MYNKDYLPRHQKNIPLHPPEQHHYKSVLTKFPNIHSGKPRRTVRDNALHAPTCLQLNTSQAPITPFSVPTHLKNLFSRRQLSALINLYKQSSANTKEEYREFQERQARQVGG
ncbi:hypothetical protein ScalyP_jg8068 [Parmales sp. scaly parma]|nr:hypothetical protein ScalyP_jg8068 [Parmales sp. scaly parma]